MKKLIVCCDGTWDTAEQKTRGVPTPSNVARLFDAVPGADKDTIQQCKYYHSGVGTEKRWLGKALGGAVGLGLDKHIMAAYRWLARAYAAGDRVYIFGFSRGAFTARSLVGMINATGLLDFQGLSDGESWERVETAYRQGYRAPDGGRGWAAGWRFHENAAPLPIHFLGVWDTVGALGIPNDMAILNLLDDPARYAFLDTRLSPNVKNARHAVALDERRASFTPTLWRDTRSHQNVRQLWFPGVHCDVGGGYTETGLADGALAWMMDAAEGCGLAFDAGMKAQLNPDPQGMVHDSETGIFTHLRTRPRSAPPLTETGAFHHSALERHRNPPSAQAPYWRTRQLKPGEEKAVNVCALERWNETGIYLQAGARYEFRAGGEWLDGHLQCGPEGTRLTDSVLAAMKDGLQIFAGQLETLYKKLTQDEQADLMGTRREANMPWGALVAAVGNGGNPGKDGSPKHHETLLVGAGARLPAAKGRALEKPGYLYCFMNDAWHFYHNNRGSVTLTVKRLS